MNDWSDAETHVERAHELYEDGKWAEAERELRHALSLNPYKPEWHFNLGLTLEAAGRYKEALEAFVDCHELDKEDKQAVLMLGVNSLRLGDPSSAIAWLEKAHKADPANADTFVHRIEAYARQGDHEQAEVMFYLSQQINHEHAGALANMAESLLARGLHDRAVWCLREAVRIDPSLPRINARLAEAYAATGRLERARQLLMRELRNDPGDIHVLLDLGCLLCDMNRLGEAAEKFRRVLEQEPDHADAHFYLADVAERQGQLDQAAEEFGLVLRLEGSDDQAPISAARTRLASLLVRRRKPDDLDAARTLLRAEFQAFKKPKSSTPAQTDVVAHATTSAAAPAAHSSEARIRFTHDDLDFFGRVLLDARMATEARAVLEEVVGARAGSKDGNTSPPATPPNPQALHALSLACFMLDDRAAGVRWARRCLRQDPKFAAAMHNIAVACVQARNWRRANIWIARAIAADPEDASLRRLRVKVRVKAVAEVLLGRRR